MVTPRTRAGREVARTGQGSRGKAGPGSLLPDRVGWAELSRQWLRTALHWRGPYQSPLWPGGTQHGEPAQTKPRGWFACGAGGSTCVHLGVTPPSCVLARCTRACTQGHRCVCRCVSGWVESVCACVYSHMRGRMHACVHVPQRTHPCARAGAEDTSALSWPSSQSRLYRRLGRGPADSHPL